MKAFWKNNPALRIVLMIVLFVLSIALVVAGLSLIHISEPTRH